MSVFCISIAEQAVEITAVRDETRGFFRDFLTDRAPDIRLRITLDDIAEAMMTVAPAASPGIDLALSAENLAIFRKVSTALIDRDVFLFHGAAIAVDGRGFIFTGDSGIGKSTHIFKWLVRCPGAVELSGDKPFILAGENPLVCGSPWGGKEGICSTRTAPLKAVVLLERAEENRMERVTLPELFPALCQQLIRPADPAAAGRALRLLGSLYRSVSFWRFRCNNFRDDCFDTAHSALMGQTL